MGKLGLQYFGRLRIPKTIYIIRDPIKTIIVRSYDLGERGTHLIPATIFFDQNPVALLAVQLFCAIAPTLVYWHFTPQFAALWNCQTLSNKNCSDAS